MAATFCQYNLHLIFMEMLVLHSNKSQPSFGYIDFDQVIFFDKGDGTAVQCFWSYMPDTRTPHSTGIAPVSDKRSCRIEDGI